jgi:hypothetical protein
MEDALGSILSGLGDEVPHPHGGHVRELVKALTDRELLTLAAWDQDNEIVKAELEHRGGEHERQTRRFAAIHGEAVPVVIRVDASRNSHES